ncbi:NifB/NifX family molybdenum-iron cluster-binding protein [Eubacteriaceae bacterium ES2]|nr:NifB/NifX family molybdenum-iron cluster-binding protein [Eubacteriaceae bacterium ES2]
MKIALTSSGKSLADQVVKEFEKAPYLLLLDTDNQAQIITEISSDSKGLDWAEIIKAYGCECVFTGEIEEAAFNVLADEGISRFKGDGITGHEAIAKMESRTLEYIRDYKGAPPGHHHH